MSASTMAPLRHVHFRRLLTGRVISTLGNSVAPIALAFAVLDLTHSAAQLGLVVGARSLANVIFLLFGGVIADRLPRNLVMVGSGVAAGLSQAVVAAVVLTDSATVPLLMGLSVINGMASALSGPASAALLSQTVPDTILKQANALNRMVTSSVAILGAAAGGVLVGFVGPGWGLAADSASFFIAAACFALVRVPNASLKAKGRPSMWVSLREGWTEFVSRTWLWVVVLGFTFYNAAHAASIGVLGPAIADETIGRKQWGVVLAAEMAGMVGGAFLAMRLHPRRLLGFGTAACALGVLMPFTLAVYPHLAILIAAGFIGGLAVEQFGIAWETTMQENVPADKLARVYSYDMLGSFIAIPVGQVAAGPAALHFGERTTMLWAVGIMLAATVGMLLSRSVREMRHHSGMAEEIAPAATGTPVPVDATP